MHKRISMGKRILISGFTLVVFLYLALGVIYAIFDDTVADNLQGLICAIGLAVIIIENATINLINQNHDSNYYKSKEFLALKDIQDKRMALEQEKINVKKLKYKRIKCEYCGSKNSITATTCVNCGGNLKGS